MVATSGSASGLWHKLPWFEMVWFAAENQGGAADGQGHTVNQVRDIRGGTALAYKKALEGGRLSDAGHLAWYLTLLRNIFGHILPGSAEGLRRSLACMQDSPVAQPTSQVIQRVRRILADVDSPGGAQSKDQGRGRGRGGNLQGPGRGRGQSILGRSGRGVQRTNFGRSSCIAMLPSSSQENIQLHSTGMFSNQPAHMTATQLHATGHKHSMQRQGPKVNLPSQRFSTPAGKPNGIVMRL